MSSQALSDDQITEILNAEYIRLHEISPTDQDDAKRIEQMRKAVKVMKIRHAQNLAEKLGANDILAHLQLQIAWADLQLAGTEENPYLDINNPSLFCQRILDLEKQRKPVPQISVEDALEQLSKRRRSV